MPYMLNQQLIDAVHTNNDDFLTGFDALGKMASMMFVRLLIDLVALTLLIRFVYFRQYRKRELFFTFFIFNLVIFLICFLLNKVELSLGAAFGLFAVFSMLRYRTEDISIKDMSYIFLVIAMGLINSVTRIKGAGDFFEYILIVVINLVILAMAWVLESKMVFRKETAQTIVYDNMDLLRTNDQEKLKEDIRLRTGINVNRISITKVDFLRNAAVLKIYYFED